MASGGTATNAQCMDTQLQNVQYTDSTTATTVVITTNNKLMEWTWEEDSQIKKQGLTKARWKHQWEEYGW